MAASQAELVLAVVGYYLIVGTLLGLSGVTGVSIEIPGGVTSQDDSTQQGFVAAVVECSLNIITVTLAGFDCSQQTVSRSFTTITDVVGFAASYLSFFFQLLTFQLPIPVFLNAIIVLPGATVLVYIGIRFARGGG